MITIAPTIARIPGLQAALDGKGALTGGNTWTGGQSITGALACTNNLQVAGGTKTSSQPMGDFYETWNNAAVTFTGLVPRYFQWLHSEGILSLPATK